MAIRAIENNIKVKTPDGHEGRTRVTRRERILISDGKKDDIDVLGTDGLERTFLIDDLIEIDDHDDHDEEFEQNYFRG